MANYGLAVSRRTLANWFINSTEKWLKPIWNKLKEHLVQEKLLHADETYYRVLSSEKQHSYYRLFRTIDQAKHPIILFQHELTRGRSVPQKFLNDFSGYLHCDVYSAYGTVNEVRLVNCWTYVRRKFFESKRYQRTQSKADQGVVYCDLLFQIEREIKTNTPHEKYHLRLEKSQPVLDEFWNWIESFHALGGSKLGKVVGYALHHKTGLMNFLKDGRCALSNNLAEQSIQVTTFGRKNWYFLASAGQ